MVDFNNLMDLQFEIFILMIIGYILRKTNIISKEHRKSLTDLVIYIVLPANIIYSFMIKMDTQIIKSGLTILIVSIIIQFACQVFGKYFFIKATKRQQSVLQYGTICSNAGFMGSPLIQGLYGLDGLLFASIYLIPQRIVMWSGGVACFTNAKGKDVIKKVITHPCIIAVFIGLFIMISQIQLPSFLKVSIQSLSNCTMALSMIVIGGILAEIKIRDVINRLTLYYSFIRLI
ncbi:MAG TPA: AEC family transporter, partial [Thomasclavelia ramosa]|nr:AEC family transporter [Thomasclavelia ramosa]